MCPHLQRFVDDHVWHFAVTRQCQRGIQYARRWSTLPAALPSCRHDFVNICDFIHFLLATGEQRTLCYKYSVAFVSHANVT